MTIHTRRQTEGFRRWAKRLSLVVLTAFGSGAFAGYNPPRGAPPGQDEATAPQFRHPASKPYLTVSAAPALRVRPPAPPPAYDADPSPGGVSYLDESTLPPAPPVAQERMEDTPTVTIGTTTTQDRYRRVQEEEVPPILPDDLRKEIRPEDVVPFFQLPGYESPLDVQQPQATPTPPAPATPSRPPSPTQIPSSATYRQI